MYTTSANPNATGAPAGLCFGFGYNGTRQNARETCTAPNMFEVGQWTHVCASVNASGTVRIFRNGLKMLEDSTSSLTPLRFQGSKMNYDSYIGTSYGDRDDGDKAGLFHGSMSDLLITHGNAFATPEEVNTVMRHTECNTSSTTLLTSSTLARESSSDPVVTVGPQGVSADAVESGGGGRPSSTTALPMATLLILGFAFLVVLYQQKFGRCGAAGPAVMLIGADDPTLRKEFATFQGAFEYLGCEDSEFTNAKEHGLRVTNDGETWYVIAGSTADSLASAAPVDKACASTAV